MPTQLPTKTVCLNCDFEVKTENKYCPNCGQENADKRISVLILLKDAFETVFNFESRVLKTIPLFLFYPGKLTTEFLAGKRVSYMHPFKIYLLSSVVFFFIVIKIFTPIIEESIRKLDKISEDTSLGFSLDEPTDTIQEQSSKDEFMQGFKDGLIEKDTVYYDNLEENFQKRQAILRDSVARLIVKIQNGELNDSTLNIDSLQNLIEDSAALAETVEVFGEKVKKKSQGVRRLYHLIQDRNMTPEALLDSIDNEKNSNNIQFAEQVLKVGRNDPAIFLANIINNIGTLMFITLPILALFFVPFYIRRQKYYIDHLIFTLHLQAFTFIILTLAALFFHWDWYSISMILGIVLIVYVWVAFKKVYNQSFFKTAIKATIISFLYITTLIFMLSINLFYSFYIF